MKISKSILLKSRIYSAIDSGIYSRVYSGIYPEVILKKGVQE
jgi:hypothetical protein